MDYNTRLKTILLEKSKNGYAIINTFNPDVNEKNRKNTKKAKLLEEQIINAGFEYKKYSITHPNKETEYNYIVFDKFDDGFNETGIKLEEFISTCKNSGYYKFLKISYNLEEYLSNKTFYHPIRKKEKEEYAQRKEIFLTDLFEPPEDINGWHIRLARSENSVLYCKRNILCSISLQPNGKWLRHYGTIQPIGVSIKKEYVETRKEAFSNLTSSFKR